MDRLHGFPISNYYNMVKMALLEKGLPFEEVEVRPNQEPDWLVLSPLGKVPCLETDGGALSETLAILDYLEDRDPDPPLLPADPFARAKVRELCRVIELYIELPARRCFPEAFFGGAVSDEVKADSEAALHRGIAGLARISRFEPWIAGEMFTQADIIWHHTIVLADRVARRLFDASLIAGLPGAEAHAEAVGARASAQRVEADRRAALSAAS